MSPFSRRIFLTASAGIAASGAAAQALDEAGRTPLAEPPGATGSGWQDGIVPVEAHGARGDCPATGSTAGASDDSDAIEAALRACPDGGIVRFSPGKSYMVSRPIRVTGKQLGLDARGARIRCRDDSVWHVFTLGGDSPEAPVEEVTVWGGIWDGNRPNQRYWPVTDGKTVFTDRGTEAWGTHQGRPFYENSPVNGTLWQGGWLRGEAGDGINVNGNGNDGLIRIQHARRAAYHSCTARDWVRNGFVTWRCHGTLFFDPQGSGQLPTHFAELKTLFGEGAEAAFLKAGGDNEANEALRGNFPHSVKVFGGCCQGGVMPIFCRTNLPKPEAAANQVVITGFEAYGFSRDLWFEEVSDVRISNCQLVGIHAPDSSARASAGVFLSNGTTDWSISDSYLRGHIDTRQKQDNRLGSLSNVVLECEAPLENWIVRCETISNTIIRARGRGAACIDAVNVDACAELNASLAVEGSAVNCRVGALRFEGRRVVVDLAPGQQELDLEAPDLLSLVRMRRMNPAVQGGKWYDIHRSTYKLEGSRLQFKNLAAAGDRIEVEWYDGLRDRFVAADDSGLFTLTQAGASRAEDILWVTLDGTPVPAAAATAGKTGGKAAGKAAGKAGNKTAGKTGDKAGPPAATAPQFAVLAPEQGRTRIQLRNLSPAPGSLVEVAYRPPLQPFAGLRLKGSDRPVRAEVVCRNVQGIRCEGEIALTGRFEDIAGLAALSLDDGTDLTLRDATVRRSRGGILAGSNVHAAPLRLRITDCLFEDWGLDGDALDEAQARAVGGNAKRGLTVSDWAILKNNVWIRSGREAGASEDPGRLRSFTLADTGNDAYIGLSGRLRTPAPPEKKTP